MYEYQCVECDKIYYLSGIPTNSLCVTCEIEQMADESPEVPC